MIAPRTSATLIFFFLLAGPLLAQLSARSTDEMRRSRVAAAQDSQIAAHKRVYDSFVAKGNDKGAAIEAGQLGVTYEERKDYANAAIWWRNAYAKGSSEGLFHFVNLVILNEITIDNPDSIRPLIEVRAFCGSQMARAYLLDHWYETPAQLPAYPPNQSFTNCGPVGPDDRMDQSLMIEARQRQYQQANAEYYRLHPDQDPKVKAQKAAEGAAMFLGALMVEAASMPASGPGSVACNRYRNRYPGANDPSVCNLPLSK